MRHNEMRALSANVDALRLLAGSEATVTAAVERIAVRRGWSDNWFNFDVAATDAEPRLGTRTVEWETVYDP